MADFKIGDVVSLASGGPEMTVQGTIESLKGKPAYSRLKLAGYTDDQIVCKYWDDSSKKFQTDYFKLEMLELSE